MDDHAVAAAYEQIKAVIDAYLSDAAKAGYEAATLLSGGIDSSLLQLAINDRANLSQPKSFSYNIHVPSFGFEVDYAREASQVMNTDHTIADIYPDAYPDLLIRSIETAAQPVPAEPEPCKLALAEFLAARADTPRFYFTGQGADSGYGLTFARKLATLNIFQRIPAAPAVIKAMAGLMQFRSAQTADGLREVARAIPAMTDPGAYNNWLNQVDVVTNLPMARRSLGDKAIQSALAYRRNMERRYRNSQDFAEQVHFVALLSESYETGTFGSQFFLVSKKEQICPFLDEDIIRIALAFKPQVRYLKSKLGFLSHRNTKPLLKQILIQKSYASLTTKRKGASVFDTDLPEMMKSGPLRDLVLSIDRPGFLSKADFETLLDRPDWFLWNLLTFDIFQKRVLKQGR
jgi:asparagine synthetase B (glutamine-hydrolysing)